MEDIRNPRSISQAADALFSDAELHVLKLFYAGTAARRIRQQFGVNPWPLVARHRQCPPDQYEAVRAQLGTVGGQE
jgi:hypothetical protein